ncbi:deaminase [Arthrobacter sp. MYb227]|uniref:dihydrofolate reductase family protein n=1 Tax=Arthrobacter sp. MYb227 TaxID=1848601 RepID=UPI000CFD2598|nr:dihydrofolate reductase family protein [Arthrobacter sp. MYb227]PQZ87357.1 deaminase [Arthrobacter sp. MYb227]
MSKLRVHNYSLSLDGFGAGRQQDLQHPLGLSGDRLHHWIFDTAYGRTMVGLGEGTTGIDHQMLLAGDENIGATIMGRNMFTPYRGPWDASAAAIQWRGWWGPMPPYHHDVIVLTHFPRPALHLAGGTTFHFITDGPEAALHAATNAAAGKDIRLGGGAAALRDFLTMGLIDTIHLAMVPLLLGSGERIFDVDWVLAGYRCAASTTGEGATHLHFVRA